MRWHLTAGAMIQYGVMVGVETVHLAVFTGTRAFDSAYGYPSSLEQGVMMACVPVTATVGCLLAVVSAVKLNKRLTIYICASVWTAAYLVQCCVVRYSVLVATRCIRGAAVGLMSPLIPLHIKEVFNTTDAQTILTVYSGSTPFGILMCSVVATFLSGEGLCTFDTCWLIMAAPAMLCLAVAPFGRSSPRDKLVRNKQRGLDDIQPLVCEICNANKKDTTMMMQFYDTNMLAVKRRNVGEAVRALVKYNPARVGIGMVVQLLVQFTGVNCIMYYIGFICRMVGFNEKDSSAATTVIYGVNFATSIGSIKYSLDRPRLPLVRWGVFMLGVIHLSIFTLMMTGHGVRYYDTPVVTWQLGGAAGWVVLALCGVFMAVFGSAVVNSSQLYLGEVIPLQVREVAMCLCVATGWLVNAVMAFVGPYMFEAMRHGTFLFYAVANLVFYCVTVNYVETLGKHEDQLIEYFGD